MLRQCSSIPSRGVLKRKEKKHTKGRGRAESCGRKFTFRIESVGSSSILLPRAHPFSRSRNRGKNLTGEFAHGRRKDSEEWCEGERCTYAHEAENTCGSDVCISILSRARDRSIHRILVGRTRCYVEKRFALYAEGVDYDPP